VKARFISHFLHTLHFLQLARRYFVKPTLINPLDSTAQSHCSATMGSCYQQVTVPTKATSLSQLLQRAAESPQERGIQVHGAGQLSEVTSISYRDLFDVASQNRAFVEETAGGRRDAVFLLHLDSHVDGIIWFWSVVVAGYTPALSPPFVNNSEQHRKHLTHLKTLLRDPIVLTTSKLVSSFTNNIQPERICAVDVLPPRMTRKAASASSAPTGLDSPASPDVLMLTSGSTGNAKAVSISHAQLLSAMAAKVVCHQTTPDDVFLNWIGLDHVANLAESHLHALYLNAQQVHVHAEDFVSSPLSFLDVIAQHGVSFSFAPNFFLASLAREVRARNRDGEHALVDQAGRVMDLSSLKCITSGGEALVVKTALSLLGDLEAYGCPRNVLVPGFGMTETCAGSIHSNRFPDYDVEKGLDFAALGTCHEGLEMRVVQVDEQGRVATAPAGEPGQLHLRGPLVRHGGPRRD